MNKMLLKEPIRWLTIFQVVLAMTGLQTLASASATNAPTPAGDTNLVQRQWFEMRTEGFWVYSCASSQEVTKLVTRLEQFRYCYAQLAGAKAVVAPPIYVFAFANDSEFKPFKPLYQGQPANLSGFFVRRSDAIMIALTLGRAETNIMQTLYHEYAHFLLRKNHFWPVWLSEGMADLYSTMEVQGETVLVGRPPARRLRKLAEKPLLPLQQLFAVKHDSSEYNEQDQQGLFYAQSWLLAHYLAMGDNQPLRDRFSEYTKLLRSGQGVTEGFTNAFLTSLPTMERELKGYLTRGQFRPLSLKAYAKPTAWLSNVTRKLQAPETAFLLGRFLLQVNRPDDAKSFFELSRQLQPKGPFGYEGLGIGAAQKKDSAEAIRQLEQALASGSKSYATHYWLGMSRLAQLQKSNDPTRLRSEQSAEIKKIKASLEETIRLMPSLSRTYFCLGTLELLQPDSREAAEKHLEFAYRMEPDQSGFGLTLARAYLLQHKNAQARELLTELVLTASDKEIKAQAVRLRERLPNRDH